MNKEILNKFLEKALQYLNSIESFTGKNVPLFLEEVVKYTIFYNSFIAFVCLLLVVTALIFINFARKKMEDDEGWMLATVITSIFAILPMFKIIESVNLIIKAWVAPRLFLVEYLKNLIQ